MPSTASKRQKQSARIEARVSSEQKRFFERAAEIQGVTLTDFVISSMHRAATEALQSHNAIQLSSRDQAVFFDALLNPPRPNEALRAAAERYARSRQSQK